MEKFQTVAVAGKLFEKVFKKLLTNKKLYDIISSSSEGKHLKPEREITMTTFDIILYKTSEIDLFDQALSMVNVQHAITNEGVILDREKLNNIQMGLLPMCLYDLLDLFNDSDKVEEMTVRDLRDAQQPTICRIGVYALSAFSGYEFGVEDGGDTVYYRYAYGDAYLEPWEICDEYTVDENGLTTFYLDGDLQVRVDEILRG